MPAPQKRNWQAIFRDNAKYFMLVAVFSFGLGVLASIVWPHTAPDATSIIAHPIQIGRDGLVNPLLAYAMPEDTSELKPLHSDLQEKVDEAKQNGLIDDIGIYFRDLDTARWTGINPDEKFSPASLLKVPVMMTYFKLAEKNPQILNDEVAYDGTFDDNGREDIQPLKSIQAGNAYTVNDLIKYMIGYSDNNATTLLFNHIAASEFNSLYTDLHLQVPTSTEDFMSPRNYSLFFRLLYNVTYLNKDLSQKALELLAMPDFPQGLAAGVPEGVTVTQKFGEHDFPDGTKELHDCGIVYQSAHPYFLCVMTKGNDFTKLANVIRDVSQIVYKAVDGNYKN